jgi:hypothetical protein
MTSLLLILLPLLVRLPLAAQPLSFETALSQPILAPNQPLVEVQVYTATRVQSLPMATTGQQ